MPIPFKRRFPAIHLDSTPASGNLLVIGLMTAVLAGCGAQVADEQNATNARPDNATTTIQPGNVTGLPAGVDTGSGQPVTPQPVPADADFVDTLPTTRIAPEPQLREADDRLASAEVASGDGTGRPRLANESGNRVDNNRQAEVVKADGSRRSEGFNQAFIAEEREQSGSAVELVSPADRSLQHNVLPHHPTLHTGPAIDRENYLDLVENSVKLVSEEPVSTFSIDVDTAGYSNIRRMIMQEGRLPPSDAVRLEEMINYFSYDYPVPDSLDEPLAIHTELGAAPWNTENQLLMVGLQGFEPDADQRPETNLVFLVDVSGSMNSPDKLGLVQRSLKLLVDQMRAEDRIALVVYAGAAGMVLDSTPGNRKHRIKHAIDSLRAGGSTNGAAGIQLAYQIAERHKIEGGINRVIIASDGDLNVGMTDIDDLKELISRKRENDIALTTLGFGSGNYNYSLMEQIADVGNGNAAYIDSLSEARKVLVEEMQSTLMTIARDVKIQIEFNPAVVKEYRLLGYENRLLNREDFTNDRVDAGEVGAGHTVTALYEVTLTNAGAGLIPDSRYKPQPEIRDDDLANELAYIKVRHKPAEGDTSTETGLPVLRSDGREDGAMSSSFRFAAAVAGFGQLLRDGKYTGSWTYDDALNLARNARGNDPRGYRNEFVRLVEMAKLL